ncbi:MAG: DNA-binding transcriptional ArsR family regulator [Gammaproteobacteria bacterium]|jgi:DNA-binding transcriptional ArsR family regulator
MNVPRPIPLLDEGQTAELADMFHLMGDGSRLRIILTCLGEPVCVGDIAEQLCLSGSLVSHHLRLLRAARVLRSQRRGRKIFYSVADEHIRHVLLDMLEHVVEPRAESEDS